MTQLALSFGLRLEHPFTRVSWREGDRTVVVELGERCVDYGWPWWHLWRPWP